MTVDVEGTTPRERTRRALMGLVSAKSRAAFLTRINDGFEEQILSAAEPQILDVIIHDDFADETIFEGHALADQHLLSGKFVQAMHDKFEVDRQVFVRMANAVEMLDFYDDDYFDWVYIGHTFSEGELIEILKKSFKKVRPGGLILGDAYSRKLNGEAVTRRALDQVLGDMNLPTELHSVKRDNLPKRIEHPSRLAQQFIIPVP